MTNRWQCIRGRGARRRTTGSLLACAAVVLAAATAGCGGVGSGPSDTGTGIRGHIDTLGFSLEDVIAKTRVNMVKKAYPKLGISISNGAFDEQAFLSSVASGDPPSLVYMERSQLGTYAARGALIPLDKCISQQHIDMSQYRQTAVHQVTYNGHVYGIPEFQDVRIVLADKHVLADAGLTPADLDTSDWRALAQVSAQMAKTSGSEVTRIGFDPKIPEFFPLWVAANGGRLMSPDGKTAFLNSPAAVQALTYTVSLVNAEGGWSKFKAFRDTWDFFGDNNELVADQVGAFPMEEWYLDVLADVSPKVAIDAVPFRDRQGHPLTYATGNAWALPKGGGDPDAACAFAATMTAPKTWIAAAKASKADRAKSGGVYLGTYTANRVADRTIFSKIYQPTGVTDLDKAVQVVQSVQDDAVVDPPSPAGAEVQKAWMDGVLRALQGDQTPQQALNQAQHEASQALSQAGP